MVAVEHLCVGDLVMTEAGISCPIKGIGHIALQKEPGAPWSEGAAPVRIAQSAISPGVPACDLYLSPEHSMFIDGCLIPVKHLVNGLTITQDVSALDVVEYFHIAFERHQVFYAEGAAVESLLVADAAKVAANFDRYEGTAVGPMVPYAPLLSYRGGRQEAVALARLVVYPWIDVRDRVQIVFDRLVVRARQLGANTSESQIAA
jgi:Hint domain